jgi:hypothetical protein
MVDDGMLFLGSLDRQEQLLAHLMATALGRSGRPLAAL